MKSPKIYLRDSGLLHALLGLATVRDLQGHPVAGSSWEGFVVEQVAAQLPADAQLSFYRTAAGAEVDLVIEHHARTVALEIKFSSAPKPARGYWQALQDLRIQRAYVVAPVPRRYPLAEGLHQVTFLPPIPKAQIPAFLAGVDVDRPGRGSSTPADTLDADASPHQMRLPCVPRSTSMMTCWPPPRNWLGAKAVLPGRWSRDCCAAR